jgi:hypothetical protein
VTDRTASNPDADPLISKMAEKFHDTHCNHRSEEARGSKNEYRPCEGQALSALQVIRGLMPEDQIKLFPNPWEPLVRDLLQIAKDNQNNRRPGAGYDPSDEVIKRAEEALHGST